VVSVTLRQLFTSGKDPVYIVQEAGWAPRPVWTGGESVAPTGIRSPDRPARSQSLYLLSYPAHRAELECDYFGIDVLMNWNEYLKKMTGYQR